MIVRLCLCLLWLPLVALGSQKEHFLILHPFYSGSHVLTLHAVAEKLVKRGHKVTTVR